MKLTAALLTSVCLASTALGSPHSGFVERLQRRHAAHQSRPMQPMPGLNNGNSSSEDRKLTNVAYSSNWAGAVREQPPPQGGYSAVMATFVVPEATAVTGQGTEAVSAWVGIDGDTYDKAILQTGVDFYAENGGTHNNAWYEWYPDQAYYFDMQINTGDTITLRVEASSPSDGVAIVENHSNGQRATQAIKAPNPDATLAGQNADWIVEDFQSGDAMVALADFSSVTFTGVEATAGGQSFGLDGATIIELQQDNQAKTDVTPEGNSRLTVNYKP